MKDDQSLLINLYMTVGTIYLVTHRRAVTRGQAKRKEKTDVSARSSFFIYYTYYTLLPGHSISLIGRYLRWRLGAGWSTLTYL